MFRKFKYALIAVLLGLNMAPAKAKTVQIPICRLDQSTINQGWFVHVGDIGTILGVQTILPPGATLTICKTSYFRGSKNQEDVVIEVGKFSNAKNAKKFGQRIWLEVSSNVVVNTGPPSGL
ncbi:hypothetical protein Cri9333_0561 [Crinalium epipsammum PCC 9333]|uniref:Uncharacterized protein n=1 Tax=Crinalium epipsammum PCC 9333 TaxID=1173022 RepID=K9VU77_9CYAN|nr:hypothetical protein [Crinalium epipsammum]AFZ11511.1 hypothetical protein Cri9333_0561 [Crinalium epipsammum PCC 9333]